MDRSCDQCGARYAAKTAKSRYCSANCRARASYLRRKSPGAVVVPLPEPPTPSGDVATATARELTAAGRLDTSAGQRALALSRLIDSPPEGTLGALAGWCREHGAAMAAALAGVKADPVKRSTLDEVRARRDAKRRA